MVAAASQVTVESIRKAFNKSAKGAFTVDRKALARTLLLQHQLAKLGTK